MRGTAAENLDTDGDGLKDWEEALWGTNSRNPDTDGDGTSDGAEVAANRNPLVAGPNDRFAAPPAANQGAATAGSANGGATQTQTEQFSQNLIDEYLRIKAAKGTLSADDKTQIGVAFANAATRGVTFKTYAPTDIRITPATPASLHAYGNAIAKAFLQNASADHGTELYILESVMESNSPSEAAQLQAISISYQSALNAILLLPVPDTLAATHLEFLNALSATISATSAMSQILADLIYGVSGLSTYNQSYDALGAAWSDLGMLLQTKNATFTQDEYGSNLFYDL